MKSLYILHKRLKNIFFKVEIVSLFAYLHNFVAILDFSQKKNRLNIFNNQDRQ